jgi:plasmid stability protein
MSTLTVQLPDGLKDQLTLTARCFGKSPARFVRETLENRLKASQPVLTGGSTLYELSRDLCGSAHGGPRDLAANKKHLAGYGSWKR